MTEPLKASGGEAFKAQLLDDGDIEKMKIEAEIEAMRKKDAESEDND